MFWGKLVRTIHLKIKCESLGCWEPKYKYFFGLDVSRENSKCKKEDLNWLLEGPVGKFVAKEIWKYFCVPIGIKTQESVTLDDISEESVTLHDISERCEKTGWELTIAFHYKEDGSIPQFDEPKPTKTYFTRAPNGLYFPSYECDQEGSLFARRVHSSPMEFKSFYNELLFNVWVDENFEEPELDKASKGINF
eukprot:GHVP01020717.1.p1 GENE.GHVP01020717.1~~GHVP01020717.1.p1  ORF type:complete len:193 (+),score=34.74 GHVP01020717.1:178-756(+)